MAKSVEECGALFHSVKYPKMGLSLLLGAWSPASPWYRVVWFHGSEMPSAVQILSLEGIDPSQLHNLFLRLVISSFKSSSPFSLAAEGSLPQIVHKDATSPFGGYWDLWSQVLFNEQEASEHGNPFGDRGINDRDLVGLIQIASACMIILGRVSGNTKKEEECNGREMLSWKALLNLFASVVLCTDSMNQIILLISTSTWHRTFCRLMEN